MQAFFPWGWMFDMMAQWCILYLIIIRKVMGSWAKDRTWDKLGGQWLWMIWKKKEEKIKVIVGWLSVVNE